MYVVTGRERRAAWRSKGSKARKAMLVTITDLSHLEMLRELKLQWPSELGHGRHFIACIHSVSSVPVPTREGYINGVFIYFCI
jgi:hypothetical protein